MLLSDYFVHDDSIIYELGSSTGKLICQIEKDIRLNKIFHFTVLT